MAKSYGIHIAVCIAALAVAFGINCQINITRSHEYTISKPIYTLLKDVAEIKAQENILELSGWAFDVNFYNEDSSCELILQDTETGEALWPKMKKIQNPTQLPEKYTAGEDYSDAGFRGSIRADKLESDRVYEILLRYSSIDIDEAGNRQPFVKTVTTDKFIYQEKMTDYNPKNFQPPEIAGTELEKELEGAKLFHYFPEGMWIYYIGERIYYIMEKKYAEGISSFSFPLNWNVREIEALPEHRRKYGFGNVSFGMDENIRNYPNIEKYKVWSADIFPEMATVVSTGIYDKDSSGWILNWEGQVKESGNE